MTGFEFFLFGMLKAALAGAAAGTMISLLMLCWDDICSWFRARSALKMADIDNVGFSLQDRLATGDYRSVHGIFNTRTGKVLDAQSVASKRIDGDLARMHRDSNLVVIQS